MDYYQPWHQPSCNSSNTDNAMGIINAAVLVLAMHIDKNQVTTIKPNIRQRGFDPTIFKAPNAIR